MIDAYHTLCNYWIQVFIIG